MLKSLENAGFDALNSIFIGLDNTACNKYEPYEQ